MFHFFRATRSVFCLKWDVLNSPEDWGKYYDCASTLILDPNTREMHCIRMILILPATLCINEYQMWIVYFVFGYDIKQATYKDKK